MNLNVGINTQFITQEEHMSQIMKEKPQMGCFSFTTSLKNNKRTSGCWKVEETIT